MSNSKRFLDAFNEMDRKLRGLAVLESSASFPKVVDTVIRQGKHEEVKRYGNDLKQLARLRNALVHETRGGQIIAEPNDWAVGQMERLHDLIIQPAVVIPLFKSKVFTLASNDPIATGVKAMYEKSYSQIPIQEEIG